MAILQNRRAGFGIDGRGCRLCVAMRIARKHIAKRLEAAHVAPANVCLYHLQILRLLHERLVNALRGARSGGNQKLQRRLLCAFVRKSDTRCLEHIGRIMAQLRQEVSRFEAEHAAVPEIVWHRAKLLRNLERGLLDKRENLLPMRMDIAKACLGIGGLDSK